MYCRAVCERVYKHEEHANDGHQRVSAQTFAHACLASSPALVFSSFSHKNRERTLSSHREITIAIAVLYNTD